MTIQEWFRDGVRYDSEGTQIWAVERTKAADYLHPVVDIRGWGEMQNIFKLDMDKAAAFQDEVGKFVAEAINEKLAKQKLGIPAIMQAEGSDVSEPPLTPEQIDSYYENFKEPSKSSEGAAVGSGAVGKGVSDGLCDFIEGQKCDCKIGDYCKGRQ